MTVKFSRFLILILVVLTASILLPYYFQLSFGRRVFNPRIQYSSVKEEFLVRKYENSRLYWLDQAGNKYSNIEADPLLPLHSYRLLLAKNIMPDSIGEKEVNIDSIRLNNLQLRVRPKEIDAPGINLYPLFESKPPRLSLFMPSNFMRITEQVEFIDAKTNQVEPEISQAFTSALDEVGFKYPAIKYFGNPTTRKAFDEGYFVIDSEQNFFHIKKVHGEPYCKKINLPDKFKVKHMTVYENNLREFYGIVFNENSEIYLLMYDHYRLQKMPVENFNMKTDNFLFRGNWLYRQMTVYKDNKISCFVTDRDYNRIAYYEEPIEYLYSDDMKMIAAVIFPFILKYHVYNTNYVGFYFSDYSYTALYLNIILMAMLLFFKRYRANKALKKWYDYAIVLVTGIYGLIAVLIYENTDL